MEKKMDRVQGFGIIAKRRLVYDLGLRVHPLVGSHLNIPAKPPLSRGKTPCCGKTPKP